MKNFEWCAYTYRHRKMFAYLVEHRIKDPVMKQKMRERAREHDLDKVLLYLFFDQRECQDYHVLHQPHHLESGLGNSYEDYLETILDYESSPYTKPDKPLNAYDFVHKLLEWGYISAEKADILLRILKELGMDRSYQVQEDAEGMAYVDSIGEVTEEMVLLEVMDYLTRHPGDFDVIRERIGKSLNADL